MKVTNKSQLTSLYNRKDSNINELKPKVARSNLSNPAILRQIEKDCYKPISGRWYVSARNVYKANNYDIVKTSIRNCSLQRKYNTCNFDKIQEIEDAKQVLKSYDSYTIKQLQDMVTVDNEDIILKAIEKKIDDQKRIIREADKARKQEAQYVAEKKAREVAKTSLKLKGIYTPCKWGINLGKVKVG